jgi:CubicO group peptidase (beta-lactamase class C family)
MAVGIAEGEGLLKVEDKLSKYFRIPDDPMWQKVTLHDLLCMGTGQRTCAFSNALANGKPVADIEGLFFSSPIVYEPGTHFFYNNSATYMLSRLISKTTGTSLNDYLKPRIYDPLGFENVQWEADGQGVNFGCSGLYLNAHELSLFGQLLLNHGMWQGKSLIPQNYIERATRKQIDNSAFKEKFATADHHSGYGYQIWMNPIPNSYRLDGLYGQYVVVLPEKQAVVTFISNEPKHMTAILDLTWKYLLQQL